MTEADPTMAPERPEIESAKPEVPVASPASQLAAAESAALLDPTLFQLAFYQCFRALVASTMTLGWSFRWRGGHHVPRRGRALLIANHQSYLDPAVAGLAAGRHLSYLARKTLFGGGFFTWAIRTLQAIPVDQEGTGIDGLRAVLKLLHAGKAVLVFPEGERCGDGKIRHPLEPGVHLLIKRGRAPVVPIGIAGAFEAWPRSQTLPMPAPICFPNQPTTIAVVVGKPLAPDPLTKLPKPELLELLYQEMSKVQAEAERLRRGGWDS